MSLSTQPAIARRAGHREQHRQEPAARRSNEDRPGDAERGQHRDKIGEFDRQAVVCRIGVIVGSAAATRVEGEHAPRSVRIARQPGRQRLEVSAGARKSGQADHRQGGRRFAAHSCAHGVRSPSWAVTKMLVAGRGAHFRALDPRQFVFRGGSRDAVYSCAHRLVSDSEVRKRLASPPMRTSESQGH